MVLFSRLVFLPTYQTTWRLIQLVVSVVGLPPNKFAGFAISFMKTFQKHLESLLPDPGHELNMTVTGRK